MKFARPHRSTARPRAGRSRRPGTPLAAQSPSGRRGLAVFAGAADFGWQYWTVGRFEVSTDDAYVQADNTTIAPKVSGYVAAVLVADNER